MNKVLCIISQKHFYQLIYSTVVNLEDLAMHSRSSTTPYGFKINF